MAVELLDFDAADLYFDEPVDRETRRCIDQAAKQYGSKKSENWLLRAYFLEPEHPLVLVALYRYFYYRHEFRDALRIALRVLQIYAGRLKLPCSWQELSELQAKRIAREYKVELRFFLLALKGAGYLELRLEKFESAIERLKKVVEIDTSDRLGAASLLQIAEDEINRKAGIYRLGF